MTTAAEASRGGSQMQAALDSGLEQLSNDEIVSFGQYTRVALSPDSSVFWVANGQTLTAKGSLHIAMDRHQDEDQTLGATQAIFTSEVLVSEFATMAPNTMWIGTWVLADVTLQIAFAARGRFYKQADLYHYSGYCVFPAMQSQIIADASDLPTGPIVSNSLPIWLSQTTFGTTTVPVYPSFLVPDNIVPPYVVAHVEPAGTEALGSFPVYDWSQAVIQPGAGSIRLTTATGSLFIMSESGNPLMIEGVSPFYNLPAEQLCRDEVDLILYGFTASLAAQYYANLISYSNTGPDQVPTFGFANSPVVRDEKRTQTEIAALAMKKSLHISANYYQSSANAIAYRLLLQAGITTSIGSLP